MLRIRLPLFRETMSEKRTKVHVTMSKGTLRIQLSMNFFNNIYIYIYIYIFFFFLNLIKPVMARPYGDIFSGFTGILKSWKRDNKTTLNNF